MVRFFQSLTSSLGSMWCQTMHPDAMWPVNGEYQCKTCLRKYRVAWEPQPAPVRAQEIKVKSSRISSIEARVA